MSGFIKWLEARSAEDTRIRAVLRRSLAFAPGAFPPAYPYVEPFLGQEQQDWSRNAHYLVAGLWALHWREGRSGLILSVGAACAAHMVASGSTSTERRFISLLDADVDQLPNRLRQVISLLSDQSIDFEGLLTGLLHWSSDRKYTQNAWARDFYRTAPIFDDTETARDEEVVS
jgi:CRISPR system Cascade subunit CasB